MMSKLRERERVRERVKRGRGRPRVCPVLVREIRRLRDKGFSYGRIAVNVGVSKVSAWRYGGMAEPRDSRTSDP